MVPKKTLSSEKTNKRCALFTKCFQQLVFFHPRAVFLLPRCSCTTNTDSNIILQGLTKLSLSGRHRVSHPQICTVQFVGFICWLNKSSSLSAWRGKILFNEQSSHTLLTCAHGMDVVYTKCTLLICVLAQTSVKLHLDTVTNPWSVCTCTYMQ